jgi:hypothetical protein
MIPCGTTNSSGSTIIVSGIPVISTENFLEAAYFITDGGCY